MQDLKDELLRTISLFEPMSLEKIYIDIDKEFVQNNPELSMEDLLNCLLELKSEKKITSHKSKDSEQLEWIKVFPKRKSWWKRIFKL